MPDGAWAGQKLAGVTQAQQATFLQQAYHCLAQPQFSYVKAAMWFGLFNNGNSSQPLDNFGLLNADYSPKPAFAAFQAEVAARRPAERHLRRLHAAADPDPPPTSGQHATGALHIAVSASDPGAGIHEITVYLTAHSREHFVSKADPAMFSATLTWLGAKRLHPGPHTIRIVAFDKMGNRATAKVTFVHGISRRHAASSLDRPAGRPPAAASDRAAALRAVAGRLPRRAADYRAGVRGGLTIVGVRAGAPRRGGHAGRA